MTPAGRHRGFTLVELIVATTVTLLVTGATVGMLRSSAGARRRADRQMAAQQEARAGVTAIATALRNASRSADTEPTIEGADDWADDWPADRLRVRTVSRRIIRIGQPESDVKTCEFFLGEPTEGMPAALMRRVDPTRNEPLDLGGVLERLAENVVALDLAYFDGLEWLDEWAAERRAPPLAVRIRLGVQIDPDSRKLWWTGRVVNFPYRPVPPNEGTQG